VLVPPAEEILGFRQVAQRTHHRGVRGHLLHPAFPTAWCWEADTTHDLGLADVQRGDPFDDLLVVL